jgi:excisionase family DNA binding protein
VSYTHQVVIPRCAPPRPECGGVGRSVFRKTDVDCPDCLQLDADRQARTAEPEPEAEAEAEPEVLMTTLEVAELFQVSMWQPRRWAKAGRITCVRTPGGRPRFLRAEIEAYFNTPEGTT